MAYPPSPIDADKNDGIDADTGAQDGPTTVGDHAGHHNALASGLNDVVTELGPNPSGSEATVQARIAAEETARAAADTALDTRLDAIEGLGSLATDAELTAGLAGKANSSHTHAIADVTALQTALDAKQDASTAATDAELSSHTSQTTGAHGGIVASSDPRLSDARTPTAHKTSHATGGSDALTPGDIGAAAATHGHAQSDITGLATALAGKQDLVQVVNQGSLGASYTLSTAGKPVTWLTGTLNANHVLTVSGLVAGAQVVLFVTQDATGGRTLTVSDGTNSSAVPVALAASAFTILRLFSTNGTDIEVDLGPEQEVTQSELDAEAAARVAGDALAVPKTLADAKGDLFAASAADTVGRLPVGTDGHVLTADAAQSLGVKWAAAPGGGGGLSATLVDAKGDLIVGTADDTVARKAVGASGTELVTDPSTSDGLIYARRHLPVPTGYYLHHPGFNGGTNKSEPSNGAAVGPVLVPRRMSFDRISLYTATTGTGNIRLLVYADDGNGRPGALVQDCGTASAATSGLKELVISLTLSPGLYWLAVVNETSGALQWNALNGRAVMSNYSSSAPGISTGESGYYKTGLTPGSPPDPFGTPGGPSSNPPVIGLRAA